MRDNDLPDLPELPSDEELGIAGLSEEDFADDDFTDPAPGDVPPGDPLPPPPPADPPPRTDAGPVPAPRSLPGWRGPLTLALLLVMVWFSLPERTMPPTREADAPVHLFSAGRAMETLADISRRPHPPGSPDHARVRRLLVERLEALGLDPEIQTTAYLRESGNQATGATIRNIVARIPGRASTGAIVLTAHYDSRALAPGAGDDGVGVVTILEALRTLEPGPSLRNDLIVLLTDAEELGLLGARAFVERHPWMDDVRLVISVEMRGGGGPSVMFETNTDNGWIIGRLHAADPAPLANSLSVDVYRRMPRDTDFTPFRERGVQGLNFAGIGRPAVYHQARDTPANVDPATIQHHGERVVAMVRDLGNQDLATVDGPPRAYFTLPFLGLFSYPLAWSLPLTGVLALIAVGIGALVVMRGGRGRGIATGAAGGLLAMGGAAAVGQGIFVVARGRHPEFGSLMGSAFHSEGWYMAALIAFALGLTTLILAVTRGRVHRGAVVFGAILPGILLALVAGLVAPAAAINLQLPALAALLAAGVVALAGPRHDQGWIVWIVALLLAVPVVGVLGGVVHLVWLAMSFSLAPLLGVAVVLTLLFLAPALDALTLPNRGWLPLTAALATLLFVGLGLRTATPTEARPAPSTLIYLQEQDGVGEPMEAFWLSRSDPGLSWARETTGTTLDREATFEGLRLGGGNWLVSTAPVVDLPTPRASIVSDEVLGGERRLEISLAPGVAAEGMGVRITAPTRIVGVGDAAVGADAGGVASVWSEGLPLDDATYRITVVHDPRLPTLDLEVVQHHQRPWELAGATRWDRPPHLAPNVMNQSDRAVIRHRLRLTIGATGDSLPSDTPGVAGALPDSLALDTLAIDSLLPDTLPPDTLPPDSLPPDSLSSPLR